MDRYIQDPIPSSPMSASWGKRVCAILRSLRVTVGPGLRIYSDGPDGICIGLASINEPVQSTTPDLRPYQLYKVVGTTLHFRRCYYQWNRTVIGGGELTMTATAGEYTIYAMESSTYSNTKITNDVEDDNDGTLFPRALYRVKVTIAESKASVIMVCDMRGISAVVLG